MTLGARLVLVIKIIMKININPLKMNLFFFRPLLENCIFYKIALLDKGHFIHVYPYTVGIYVHIYIHICLYVYVCKAVMLLHSRFCYATYLIIYYCSIVSIVIIIVVAMIITS